MKKPRKAVKWPDELQALWDEISSERKGGRNLENEGYEIDYERWLDCLFLLQPIQRLCRTGFSREHFIFCGLTPVTFPGAPSLRPQLQARI